MRTPVISIVLFAVAAFFGAAGRFLYKSGTIRPRDPLGQFISPMPGYWGE